LKRSPTHQTKLPKRKQSLMPPTKPLRRLRRVLINQRRMLLHPRPTVKKSLLMPKPLEIRLLIQPTLLEKPLRQLLRVQPRKLIRLRPLLKKLRMELQRPRVMLKPQLPLLSLVVHQRSE